DIALGELHHRRDHALWNQRRAGRAGTDRRRVVGANDGEGDRRRGGEAAVRFGDGDDEAVGDLLVLAQRLGRDGGIIERVGQRIRGDSGGGGPVGAGVAESAVGVGGPAGGVVDGGAIDIADGQLYARGCAPRRAITAPARLDQGRTRRAGGDGGRIVDAD